MDLASLKTKPLHDAGAEMQVVGPDGQLTDAYITLVGPDSEIWRQVRRRVERKVLAASASGAEADIDLADIIATATIGWRGLESDGEPVECTHEAALDLYANAPYIRDQADRFIADRGNFTGG